MLHMDLGRARKLMRERGIDVLVSNTEDNVYYASGYKDWMAGWCPILAIIPADATLSPAMICSDFLEVQVKQKTYITDVRTYPLWMPIVDVEDLKKGTAVAKERPKQFMEELVFQLFSDIIAEKGLKAGVIAVESSLLKNQQSVSIMTKLNPKIRLVEGDDLFWDLRKIKTEAEIKYIRIAASLGAKGLEAVIEDDLRGVSMGELHLRYNRGIWDAASADNAMDLKNVRLNISAGEHFATMENPGYCVSEGDMIWVDNGVTVFGYTSDMGRTFSVGKPTELQRGIFETIKEGYEKAVSLVKPGVQMKEIFLTLQETVHQKGYNWYARGHMGHSVGIGRTEQPPFITPEEQTVLEPNMVICVECGLYTLGKFGAVQIEDMFFVTPSGHELLTPLSRDMVEL